MTGAQFDAETDLLVIGSGAGGLTAALTASIEGAQALVVEKSDRYGGTSAMSGGGIWIPNSHHLAALRDASDSSQEALDYLRALIGDEAEPERLEAFVEQAPKMLAYLERHSRVACEPVPYSDYYPELPGGKSGYRTHQPLPMHARRLGAEFGSLRGQHPQTLVAGRITMTMMEARAFLTRAPGWRWTAAKIALGYMLDLPGRLKGKRARRLALGNALVGRLRWSLLERKVPLWLNTALEELISEGGSVVGAVLSRDGQRLRIRARRGVVLACGGFEHNRELREKYLPQPTNPEWSASQENNTGDGLLAAQALGAATRFMEHAWWVPAIKIPRWDRPYVLMAERANPGLIIVNQRGERFANEAAPYQEAGRAFYDCNRPEAPTVPAWAIFDGNFRSKYVFSPLVPDPTLQDKMVSRAVREILVKCSSLDELAGRIGVDPAVLAETVRRNNEYAKTGVDPEFHRGESAYDRYYGDARNEPNPCIAPIARPPFYALPMHPGDIGTKGGLATDAFARVLRGEGEPIAGLYAVGNCAASVMGSTYPGAGSTLGPAMTFAYLAAKDAVAGARRETVAAAA
jgi:3-oxosteroid 1-dehydrogenase